MPKDERWRRAIDFKDVEKMNRDSKEVFFNNIIDTYYPKRPEILDNMCLYDFASKFDYKTTPCSHRSDPLSPRCFKLNNDVGFHLWPFKRKTN